MPRWIIIVFIILVCLTAIFFWIRNLRVVFLQAGSVDQIITILKKNIQETAKTFDNFQEKYIPFKDTLKENIPALINQELNSTTTPLTN
jgi:hypothetical protein